MFVYSSLVCTAAIEATAQFDYARGLNMFESDRMRPPRVLIITFSMKSRVGRDVDASST